jgi:hypothetical protein
MKLNGGAITVHEIHLGFCFGCLVINACRSQADSPDSFTGHHTIWHAFGILLPSKTPEITVLKLVPDCCIS